ncbi:MAG TPA: type III-B CRISPR module-associated protein Cmr3 [Peptococcaceae bacterium]|nr:type III-B CRISPR module-associated protein Cmr3 [Peptococcaceae bacterium]
MTVWIIEPRDPLVVRDGRPFGPVPGARAVSLAFPFPSTITGAVRTHDGLDAAGRFQLSEVHRVKDINARGPLLVELDSGTGDVAHWLVPAPADALLLDLDPDNTVRLMLKPLVPLQMPPGARTDLPNALAPVGMPRRDPRKPSNRAPRYWYWEFFQQWLSDPREREVSLADLGHDGPVREARIHVGIRPETKTADEERGALFQTQGLEFTHALGIQKLSGARRLGLAVATDAPNLKSQIAPLGGERRLVFWRQSRKMLPTLPEEVKENIADQRHCRLILLTPAHFKAGWKPTWLLREREGVKPSAQAVALRRYETVSGWDFDKKQPKATRRLAPAGTVFFLKLEGNSANIKRWIDTTWMQCISDEQQDRRDGFGLAVLGVWDGQIHRMEV